MNMRYKAFASRNFKEIARDPLSVIFGLGLPILLLVLLSMIGKSENVPQFKLSMFAPAMAVFSLSFTTLFSGLLIGRDRQTAFLQRMFAAPMTAAEYLLAYTVPMLVFALAQGLICFAAGAFLGMDVSLDTLAAVVMIIPISLVYIGTGVLLGAVFTDKQVGAVSSLFINISTILSGTWFELKLVGGPLEAIGNALPFAHGVNVVRMAAMGDYKNIAVELLYVLGYAAVLYIAAALMFGKKMKNGGI